LWLAVAAVAGAASPAGCDRQGLPAATPAPTAAGPAEAPSPIEFVDVAAAAGVDHRWPIQPRPMRVVETFGAGCGLVDFDLDRRLDVLLVSRPHPRLYRNLDGRRFAEITAAVGLDGHTGNWTGCAVGDYDGDGLWDLLLTGIHRIALLRNTGAELVDATAAAGFDSTNHDHWGASAGFMDLDNDQDLDLVVLNYIIFGPDDPGYCELALGVLSGCPPETYRAQHGQVWQNLGDGRFEQAPADWGMGSTSGKALVLAFTDLDGDGRVDLYIGNDGTPAELMHNQGDLRFANIGMRSGVALNWDNVMAAMAADWADYDRDGRLDLTVTGFSGEPFAVYRRLEGMQFNSVGDAVGIGMATHRALGFGGKWIDADNDAWPDVAYVNGHVYDAVERIEPGSTFRQRSMLFHNRGGRFVDVVPRMGGAMAAPILGRGLASGDFDDDGRVDLLAVDYEGPALLLHNRTTGAAHWIRLDLRGAGGNRFALGARVTARAAGQVWVAEVSPASSYLSASDPRIHFGLGPVERLETVEVRWPSGRVETLVDVAADRILLVAEGRGIVSAAGP
jgi:hypothetical protein